MPSIKLDKKTVLQLVGKNVSDEILRERLPMLGTDLDSISTNEIDIEIFPNRPDFLSEQGLARALSTFLGFSKGLKTYKAKKSNYKMIIDESVKNVRPYTACAVVKNLIFNDEKIKQIIQIQEKLHVTYGRKRKKAAIGIYPLEAIQMPITFKADIPEKIIFQPLESNKEMNAKEILERHPTGKEYAPLLEGLKKYPYFIDAKNDILSMPPVINSNKTGRITKDTKEVFIECSGFNKKVLSICLNMIVCALSDMGGTIYEIEVQNKHEKKTYTLPELEPEEMKISRSYVNKRLGIELTEKELQTNLEKMGLGYSKGKALIPCYRADIIHEIDLIEDVAIAYGYDNFTPVIPEVSTIGEEAKIEKFKQKLRELLIGFGFFETYTYNITSSHSQTEKMDCDIPLVKLANSLTIDFDCLRAWVIPSLMDTLVENKRHDYPQYFYDFGRIFKNTGKGETGVTEHERLAVALADKDIDFTKIKQVIDSIFASLGKTYSIKPAEHNSFISGRCGRISFSGKEIGYIGEIHPQVLENFELEIPVSALELNITELFSLFQEQ